MKNGVTIQDIANTLKLSRNTVSKVLNGKYVPQKTRNLVLNTAIEMGYKSYNAISSHESSFSHKNILIISSRLLLNINYYVIVMRGIESALSDMDVELTQFTFSKRTSLEKLNSYLNHYKVDGIICMELFDEPTILQLTSLGYPIVFLDATLTCMNYGGNYDIVLPENFDAIKSFCTESIRHGVKSFGFVGDYAHCKSFYERFLGMRESMFLSGLQYDPELSITEKDSFPYGNVEEMTKRISKMDKLPDCFICANDTIAVSMVDSLKALKIKCPEISVTGFDNTNDSKKHIPPVSTFNVDKMELGKKLLTILIERINSPKQGNRIIYIKSKFISRATSKY